MLATRWEPWGVGNMWAEMSRLQEEMDQLFGRYGVGNGRRRAAPAYPALNLWQDDENLYCEAELPGMELKDLEIFVTGGDQLTIKGKREAPSHEHGIWHRRERGYGSFGRVITLPRKVASEKVEAEFCHGVLCITLPKHEEAKSRRIEVKSG